MVEAWLGVQEGEACHMMKLRKSLCEELLVERYPFGQPVRLKILSFEGIRGRNPDVDVTALEDVTNEAVVVDEIPELVRKIEEWEDLLVNLISNATTRSYG